MSLAREILMRFIAYSCLGFLFLSVPCSGIVKLEACGPGSFERSLIVVPIIGLILSAIVSLSIRKRRSK